MRFDLTQSFLLALAFALCAAMPVCAQHTCGTHLIKDYAAQYQTNPDNQKQKSQIVDPCVDKTISVVAWVSSPGDLVPVVSQGQVQAALNKANNQFRGSCLNFTLCHYEVMPEHRFWSWDNVADEPDALSLHYRPGNINMYFCDTVKVGGSPVGGYAYLPGGPDVVLIHTGSMGGNVVAHELGHFFGLLHTWEKSTGLELVDGSNCTTTGDFICDTEADPYDIILGIPTHSADSTCNAVPFDQDTNGDWYLPPTNNIMSYYTDLCDQKFTVGQLNYMVNQYLNFRNYLW